MSRRLSLTDKRYRFRVDIEEVEDLGQPMITVGWRNDHAMTFGKELAFDDVECFVDFVESLLKFGAKNEIFSDTEIRYFNYILNESGRR